MRAIARRLEARQDGGVAAKGGEHRRRRAAEAACQRPRVGAVEEQDTHAVEVSVCRSQMQCRGGALRVPHCGCHARNLRANAERRPLLDGGRDVAVAQESLGLRGGARRGRIEERRS